MSRFVVVFAALLVGSTLLNGLGMWVSRKSPVLRDIVALILAAGSAYAVSFVLYIWVLAGNGAIRPASNVGWPSFTWLWIAIACIISAYLAKGSRYARAMPFAVGALLSIALAQEAPSASSSAQQLVFIAVPQFVIGIATLLFEPKRAA
jgi:hypothetical protein